MMYKFEGEPHSAVLKYIQYKIVKVCEEIFHTIGKISTCVNLVFRGLLTHLRGFIISLNSPRYIHSQMAPREITLHVSGLHIMSASTQKPRGPCRGMCHNECV